MRVHDMEYGESFDKRLRTIGKEVVYRRNNIAIAKNKGNKYDYYVVDGLAIHIESNKYVSVTEINGCIHCFKSDAQGLDVIKPDGTFVNNIVFYFDGCNAEIIGSDDSVTFRYREEYISINSLRKQWIDEYLTSKEPRITDIVFESLADGIKGNFYIAINNNWYKICRGKKEQES